MRDNTHIQTIRSVIITYEKILDNQIHNGAVAMKRSVLTASEDVPVRT